MKAVLSKLKSAIRQDRPKTEFVGYNENIYGKEPRITNEDYRRDLVSWQIPAIKEHCGDLSGKVFIDIGAGDIVLGEHLAEIGVPQIFYAQDLSQVSLDSGIQRMKQASINTAPFITLSSDNFNFDSISDQSIDYAFSNSLFSHLSINSILLCLRRLAPKMKYGGTYISSMIVVPETEENEAFNWSFLNKKGTNITSYPTKDPFHYSVDSIRLLTSYRTGFTVKSVHEYGHPFQKLVEFERTEERRK